MGSEKVRSELSKKNKWYISKHRFLELQHYCLQYKDWVSEYKELEAGHYPPGIIFPINGSEPSDNTGFVASRMAEYKKNMELVENTCRLADEELAKYIFMSVTNEGIHYTYLRTKLDMPCGKDMFYDRYRKFFWLLSERKSFA